MTHGNRVKSDHIDDKNTWFADPYLLLLGTLTLFALAPLYAPGYFFNAHDGRHSIFFLTQFDASIRDGALFPRWAMHHIQGYGYPTFIIQAPLGFYLAEVFVLLGAGYTLAAKLAWTTGFLLSAWGMYRLVLHWLSLYSSPSVLPDQSNRNSLRLAALIAGLLYVYVPYHLLDIYVRAALNDALLLAWFPWVFLAFDSLIDGGGESGWPGRLALAILALGGILMTHTFALLSFTPLLITFVLFRLWQRWRMQHRDDSRWTPLFSRTGLALAAGLLGLLMTSAFLIPLLAEGGHLEQQVYVTDTYNYRNHFVFFGQFFDPMWGFGFSDDPTGVNDGMGFQLGLMAVLFVIGGVFVAYRSKNTPPFWDSLIAYLVMATLIIMFLMMPASTQVWNAIPPLGLIQFPWRLLALTAFTTSALSGIVTSVLLRYESPGMSSIKLQPAAGAFVIALLVVFSSYAYVQAELLPVEQWREDGRAVFRFEEEHPDMIAYTEWVTEPFTESPMSDDYRSPDYVEDYSEDGMLTRLAIVDGAGTIISQYSRGSSGGGVVQMETPGKVRIHEFYFPGWQASVDGNPVPIVISQPHGLLEVEVPAGQHRIDARMEATPIRLTGAVLSWAVLLLVVGLLVWSAWVRRQESRNA